MRCQYIFFATEEFFWHTPLSLPRDRLCMHIVAHNEQLLLNGDFVVDFFVIMCEYWSEDSGK